jgi:putative flippase GtrA
VKLREFVSARRQFLLYCVIGVCGVGLHSLVYFTLVRYAGFHYEAANTIGYNAGTICTFSLNVALNFKTRDRLLVRFLSFYSISLLGWFLSSALLWLLIERAGLGKFESLPATLVLVVLVQYNLNRWISFRKRGTTA